MIDGSKPNRKGSTRLHQMCARTIEMVHPRRIEMSDLASRRRAWEARVGLGDDERTRSATDRGTDGSSGETTYRGVGSDCFGHRCGRWSGCCCATETTVAALIHRSRGRSASDRLRWRSRVRSGVVRQNYRDFGPTLATEDLLERHGVAVSRETLRKWMAEAGLWLSRKQRRTFHHPRLRRESYGELVQIDGSEHRWFENRGEPCTLLVFIDDATSRLMQTALRSQREHGKLLRSFARIRPEPRLRCGLLF